ncbi:sce7725 family protein [Streptococcus sanguinis]|jgi:sepS16B protein|uniref:SepS16B protein n=1 Tax=Streptococcus sanguinis SK115 TaxID=888810 RepID=F0IAH2_STRSA|nr:sce7725 family protein [Streptococcus sanguinis]EGD31130.1 sepS16B protein [Streptococcus sanguinis SK115]MBZ2054047.1 sce7725 family protein [Streptococcus sanguinis]MBZ2067078.1 sce7725 family protein [Streptococcus sanguinis]
MYFPYLRGRQYELIALRELLANNKLGNNVIPIIEPVKLSPTLVSTLEAFETKKQPCALIMNPAVGSFNEEYSKNEKNRANRLDEVIEQSEHLYYASLMSRGYQKDDNFKQNDDMSRQIIICKDPDDLNGYEGNYSTELIAYNLIGEDSKLNREVSGSKVKISDRFKKAPRNVDYAKKTDEFFSKDHKYFLKEGYKGFSDYSIVGESYSDSGFAPTAIAIHIVYFNEKQDLRIHHFVSDTNENLRNQAGKFEEALEKLLNAIEEGKISQTMAIKEFQRLSDTKTYPGLGTIKKLTMMHHIELVGKYLDQINGDR